jgi:hypothetical protein
LILPIISYISIYNNECSVKINISKTDIKPTKTISNHLENKFIIITPNKLVTTPTQSHRPIVSPKKITAKSAVSTGVEAIKRLAASAVTLISP